MSYCGVILAGGKSTRMGTNKSFLQLDNKPIIEYVYEELTNVVDDIIIIANERDQYKYLGVPIFQDRYMNKGPLAGIESALANYDANTFLFTACDMPFIQQEVFHYLLTELNSEVDAIVPVFQDRLHPLSGIYTQTALRAIQQQLDKNELKVMSFYEHIRVRYVDSFENIADQKLQQHFFNMNNPAQYEEAVNTYRLFNHL